MTNFEKWKSRIDAGLLVDYVMSYGCEFCPLFDNCPLTVDELCTVSCDHEIRKWAEQEVDE